MSTIRDVDPIFMDNSDIAIKDEEDEGCINKCLEINEFSVACTNRELVNLENAAVNIDNSNDVIIGPVTQFNVNGNVTIYQNKDGLPIGIERKDNDSKDAFHCNDCNSETKDASYIEDPTVKDWKFFVLLRIWSGIPMGRPNIKYSKWICALIVLTFVLTVFVKMSIKRVHTEILPVYVEDGNSSLYCTCHIETLYKPDWGGKLNTYSKKAKEPMKYVVIKQTGGGFCQTKKECIKLTKKIQLSHLSLKYSDIAYNFLIGGDGNIYVGRNFGHLNQSNNITYDIAIHGNFLYDEYYEYMQNATQLVIAYGLWNGFITENFSVLCGQTLLGDGAGRNLFQSVRKWSNYSNKTIFS